MYDTRNSLDELLKELLNLLHGTCDVTTIEEQEYLESRGEGKIMPNVKLNFIKVRGKRTKRFRFRSRYEKNNQQNLSMT